MKCPALSGYPDELLQLCGRAGERCFYRVLRLLRGRFCFRRLACSLPGGGALFVAFDDVLEGKQVLREACQGCDNQWSEKLR